jgi:hypothetical protein
MEFTWPAYREFKRRPGVPRLLAYNRTDDRAAPPEAEQTDGQESG